MCLENKVLEKTTCDNNLTLDERLEIAYERSEKLGSKKKNESSDLEKEITK